MERKLLEQVVFYGLLLALWEALVLAQVWPPYLFPSPLGVLRTIAGGLSDSSIPVAVGVSLRRIVVGYGISIVCGIVLGLLTGEFPLLGGTIGRLVLGLQTLPSICWLPLAMLWFGLNERAISFVVVMGAVLAIRRREADMIHIGEETRGGTGRHRHRLGRQPEQRKIEPV
jgi:NitT/TauT family transport system permease protein